MANVLGVGNATLDIVSEVDTYPSEDSEVRASARHTWVGGNAANLLSVLALHGHHCRLVTLLSTDPAGRQLAHQLRRARIDLDDCPTVDGPAPLSHIILCRDTGSRSIVHHRGIGELATADISQALGRRDLDWLHVEVRPNTAALTEAITAFAVNAPTTPISMELEKERRDSEDLLALAQVVFFSKELARGRGFLAPEPFLRSMAEAFPNTTLVCPWAERGAYAIVSGQDFIHAPAHPPAQLIDTRGAGDTFIAGFVDARLGGKPTSQALERGCHLAGRKCAALGLSHLTMTPR